VVDEIPMGIHPFVVGDVWPWRKSGRPRRTSTESFSLLGKGRNAAAVSLLYAHIVTGHTTHELRVVDRDLITDSYVRDPIQELKRHC
jgi:hypothetical protein